MELQVLFGKRLKEIRESLFMTQEALAEKLGIHRNTLVRIEKGETFTSAETIEKIKNVLQIEYKDLFSFDIPVKKNLNNALKFKLEELNEVDREYFLLNIEAYIKAKKENQLKE